jgi:hypothetical protein
LIAVACQFAATSLQLFHTDIESVTLPAITGGATLAGGIRHGAANQGNDEWASAMSVYLDNVESALKARLSIETLGKYLPLEGITAAVHPLLLRLAICALISATRARRGIEGDVTMPYGTMLAFIAWYNPVLAEALRLCVKP